MKTLIVNDSEKLNGFSNWTNDFGKAKKNQAKKRNFVDFVSNSQL